VSLIKPDYGSSEIYAPEECRGSFVVSCFYGSVLLELLEEVLDQMTPLVYLLVIRPLLFFICLGRDHGLYL
jgi:hypothetical protein